ncbi:MAG: sulfotransferase family protein [Myxococcota bacterium]
MKRIDLVFRTVGERTSELALELAKTNIRPDRVFIFENIRPFSETVQKQLKLNHNCDIVVYMDADCLILENMRPFLESNESPYVDCFVQDRFRGAIHCGVHLTRIDLVDAMRRVSPPINDLAYVLRPESRLRNLAMQANGWKKSFKNFFILHDHFQRACDIFAKYALRELRSRTKKQRLRLDTAMQKWGDDTDFVIARAALAHANRSVPPEASASEQHAYIRELPRVALEETRKMPPASQKPLLRSEVEKRAHEVSKNRPSSQKPKVFGLGLSRTGTRSLTAALQILGWDCLHYPTDEQTFKDLSAGKGLFQFLNIWDGLTDITAAPYYAQLDANYPGSKFILTVRDTGSWLRSANNHWTGRDPFAPAETDAAQSHMKIRRLLRAATYGCYEFEPTRFRWVFEQHRLNVERYFQKRSEDLLVIDICNGEGFEKLAPFLGVPEPIQPFPHKGFRLSEQINQERSHSASPIDHEDDASEFEVND